MKITNGQSKNEHPAQTTDKIKNNEPNNKKTKDNTKET